MNKISRHVTDYLAGISQAFFFEKPLFGAVLLTAVLYFSPYQFAAGALASLISYAYSVRYSTPKLLRKWGLLTINGFFFGVAMASLFTPSPAFWVCLALGAMTLPLITKAVFEVLQHWKLSPFIIPYILTVWVIWLCGRGTEISLISDAWPDQMAALAAQTTDWSPPARIAWATLHSMGRLLFLSDPLFGLSVLVLVTLFDPRRGLYFALGATAATALAYLLSGGSAAWEQGYLSYAACLVGLALASFPEKFGWQTILVFSALSTLISAAAEELLGGMNIPPLSLAYVLTLWVGFLSRVPRVSVSWESSSATRALPSLIQGPKLSVSPIEPTESEQEPEQVA